MPSLIPGYEYDIFISYRHKDNKGDKWVTEFVRVLKTELESTFKEDISIYFDENPHDGLLETHHVDKSLEGKLKCLIFIPILSQTYCDPKSFAWQHEFCAFNRLAKQDQLGRDIKLNNGNVSSRILPIKIHDIDAEDKAILETEIGGVLRAIDFIYKEAGVNRPLRSNEENPAKNQNQTTYRNQVNKVANAIKEIISAMKAPASSSTPSIELKEDLHIFKSHRIRKSIITAIVLFLVVFLSGYYFYPKLVSDEEPIDKFIAVLPFSDMSPEHNQEYFGDGMAEEIINVLAQSEDIKVISRSSSFQFKGKNEDLRVIGNQLGVSMILEGSVRKQNNSIRVTAQLIRVSDGSHFWSKTFEEPADDVFRIQDEIAAAIASAMKATLKESTNKSREIPWNEEAKRLYQEGRYFFDRDAPGDPQRAFDRFSKSIALDSNHAISISYFSAAANNSGNYGLDEFTDKALELDPFLPEANALKALRYTQRFDFNEANRHLQIALKYGKSSTQALRIGGRIYSGWGRHEEAIRYCKLAFELDPLQSRAVENLGDAFYLQRDYKQALHYFNLHKEITTRAAFNASLALLLDNRADEALKELNNYSNPTQKRYASFFVIAKLGQKAKIDSLIQSMASIAGEKPLAYFTAVRYANLNDADKAFTYLEEAYKEKSIGTAETCLTDPLLDPIRSDPRWKPFIEKLNYPKKDSK